MNAIRYLLKVHEEIGKLFSQFAEAGDQAYKQKQTIAEQVIEKMTMNAEMADEVIFPAFAKRWRRSGGHGPRRAGGTSHARIHQVPLVTSLNA